MVVAAIFVVVVVKLVVLFLVEDDVDDIQVDFTTVTIKNMTTLDMHDMQTKANVVCC